MTAVPDRPPALPLFRAEALDAGRPQALGGITLLPDPASRWIGLAALLLVAGLIALLALGHYTRRSTVTGQLLPRDGLIRVVPAQGGVVVERRAVDGQQVKQGDVLFVLSGDRAGTTSSAYQRDIGLQIEVRRQSLESDLRRGADAQEHESLQLRRRIDSLRTEAQRVATQGNLLAQRMRAGEDTVRRYQGLLAQGYASRDEVATRESELIELRARLEGNRRDALTLGREIGAAQRELETVGVRYANQRGESERAIALTRQEFAEVEARRRVVVSAPADGRLTLVQGEIGQTVDTTRPLAQVIPQNSRLVARLYVPSRAVGFVQAGGTVLLRYDAFPYQRFGQQVATVEAVSTAAAAPTELQSLTLRPELLTEPLFAVSVSIPSQTIAGPQGPHPLQSGMRVEGDLLHETRALYQWLLEPLFSAQARLKNG